MHVQYELVVNLLPCRLGHLHMALFARSLAFFVPGGGPSFTTLHSLVMWFTVNFVLCSTMYPKCIQPKSKRELLFTFVSHPSLCTR